MKRAGTKSSMGRPETKTLETNTLETKTEALIPTKTEAWILTKTEAWILTKPEAWILNHGQRGPNSRRSPVAGSKLPFHPLMGHHSQGGHRPSCKVWQ